MSKPDRWWLMSAEKCHRLTRAVLDVPVDWMTGGVAS